MLFPFRLLWTCLCQALEMSFVRFRLHSSRTWFRDFISNRTRFIFNLWFPRVRVAMEHELVLVSV